MSSGNPERAGRVRTVLVVDDDAAAVRLMSEALKKEGFGVVTARNGAQCLSLVACHRLDVVILDVAMPQMDGIEALKALRDDPKTRSLPVILVTGQEDFGNTLEGWNSGAESCFRKPLQMANLVREVKRLAK